jgi:iron complex outermembrane receptor protein
VIHAAVVPPIVALAASSHGDVDPPLIAPARLRKTLLGEGRALAASKRKPTTMTAHPPLQAGRRFALPFSFSNGRADAGQATPHKQPTAVTPPAALAEGSRSGRGRYALLASATALLLSPVLAYGQAANTTTPTPTDAPTAETAAAASTDQAQVMAKFTVTGSNIANADEALAIPVAVVSAGDIQNSGVETDILDVLRKVSPAITGIGGENATVATANNYGGSSVNIHNLPTLVLVNGRRMAYDPSDAGGGVEFVDLNTIPYAAVDRIEILSDGSSAIYGADAVGGVINIILKKDFNGWQMDTHYGFSDNAGHYSERRGDIVGGVSNGTTSITASVEYSQSDPIFESNRPYTNPFYATTYVPGIVEIFGLTPGSTYDEAFQLASGVNAPPGGGSYTMAQLVAMGVYKDLGSFNNSSVLSSVQQILNLAQKETLQQYSKRESATINMDRKIFGDTLEGFAYLLYSHTNTWSQLNAQPLFPYISDPNSDLGIYGVTPPAASTEYVPIGAPTNPLSQASLDQGSTNGAGGDGVLVHNRFVTYPRVFQNDGNSLTVVGGLKGKINENWSWEMAADISRYQLNYTNPGVLDTLNLIQAFVNGTVNPFAISQAPGALNGVVGTAAVNFLSTNNTYDALLRGSLFSLPAGDVKFAAGGSYSRQNLSAVPDFNTENQLWDDSPTILPFDANRTISSLFAELEIPVVDKSHPLPGIYSMDIDAAERYDAYSGKVGDSKVPKVNAKYQPFDDQLTLRASAGKSFIAPQLYELYGPTTQGSSDQVSYTGANGVSYTNVQFQAVAGSNPDLKPSTSTTWSVGFVYNPRQVKNLSLTFDYYQTDEKAVVGTIDESTIIQSVEDLGAASPYAPYIRFGSPAGPGLSGNTPGQISSRPLSDVYILDPEVNIGAQAIKGFDASIEYVLPFTEYGKFEVNSTVTVYNSFLIQELPTQNYFQYAGHVSTTEELVAGQGGTVPRWRSYTTLSWKKNGVSLFAAQTFVPTVTDVGSGGPNGSPELPVASYAQYDFAASFNFGMRNWNRWLNGLTVRAGVDNAFNYEPPVAPYRLLNTLADVGEYGGAIGRMFFVDASYKF